MRKFVTMMFAFAFVLAVGSSAWAADGAEVFSKKCKTCHSTGTNKILGPGLAGITQRATPEWIKAWVSDPQGVWEADEGYTKTLKAAVKGESRKKTKMKVKIKPDEVDAVVEYLKTL